MRATHKTSIVFVLCIVCMTACSSKGPSSAAPVVPGARDASKAPAASPTTAAAERLGPNGQVFGDAGNAHRIVFCSDDSGSMINKIPTLKDQIAKAVNSLQPTQSFEIIFFQNEKYDSFMKFVRQDDLVPATTEMKKKVYSYLDGVTTTGETDPIPGITGAFKSKPDLIYLLTDGDFPDNDAVLKLTRDLNSDRNPKVRINTIAFVGDGDNEVDFLKLLKTIAKESGGTFRHVKESELN
jgi:hypothetical protein